MAQKFVDLADHDPRLKDSQSPIIIYLVANCSMYIFANILFRLLRSPHQLWSRTLYTMPRYRSVIWSCSYTTLAFEPYSTTSSLTSPITTFFTSTSTLTRGLVQDNERDPFFSVNSLTSTTETASSTMKDLCPKASFSKELHCSLGIRVTSCAEH